MRTATYFFIFLNLSLAVFEEPAVYPLPFLVSLQCGSSMQLVLHCLVEQTKVSCLKLVVQGVKIFLLKRGQKRGIGAKQGLWEPLWLSAVAAVPADKVMLLFCVLENNSRLLWDPSPVLVSGSRSGALPLGLTSL